MATFAGIPHAVIVCVTLVRVGHERAVVIAARRFDLLAPDTGVVAITLKAPISVRVRVAGITDAVSVHIQLTGVEGQRTVVVTLARGAAGAGFVARVIEYTIPIEVGSGAAVAVATIQRAGRAAFAAGFAL